MLLTVRTFADPNEEQDMKEAYRLQDALGVEQADTGKFEVPDWNKKEVEQMRETTNVVASTVTDSSKMFGKKEELDPVYWMLGAALGWGGLPAETATYVNVVPEKNDDDGVSPSTLEATPRRTISYQSYRDGTTSCGSISLGRRSWMAAGRSRSRRPLNKVAGL